MPKRKGSKKKKGALKKIKLETETEVESILDEHTRDVTEIIRKEEELERQQKLAAQRRRRQEAQHEAAGEGEENEDDESSTGAYSKLLQAFGSNLSENIKKRKEQLKEDNRKRFNLLQQKAREEEDAENGDDAGGDEDDDNVEGEEFEEEEEGDEDGKAEAEDGDEEGDEDGEEEMDGDEFQIPEEEREDETQISEAELMLMGVEDDAVDDPFRTCFAFDAELANDLEAKPVMHKDDTLGIVHTRLPASTRAKLSTSKKQKTKKSSQPQPAADFPPTFGSRPRTSLAAGDSAHSLVDRFKMKKRLAEQWESYIGARPEEEKKMRGDGVFTPLQETLFPVFNEYMDLFHSARTTENAEELRSLYMLHILNHTLKTRDTILKNNAKWNAASEEKRLNLNIQDQGFVRPKVLIMVPFRNAAMEIVKLILKLAPKLQQEQVMNKRKFFAEFGVEEETINPNKPKDYLELMAGNVDDCFRMGISFTKKTVKLFEEFYHSDIILASPLGLRMIVGAPGDTKRDFDFLSSIEILVLDQADVFLMQNFDHLTLLMDVMNEVPKSDHGCDFSRIRTWFLNGWAKQFRQTLMFSAVPNAQLHALINRKCNNMRGIVKVSVKTVGSIAQVIPKIRQVFQRIDCSLEKLDDYKFNFFMKKIWPHLKLSVLKHVFIYVPSYFDYVRLRNAIKEDPTEPSISLICEYTTDGNVARARSHFFHGKRDFMLYTERFHFFRRYKIRGIRNVIFYGLPQYPHFYSEILNLLTETEQEVSSVTALYSKFDIYQLQGIVGDDRAKIMLKSSKDTHLFC